MRVSVSAGRVIELAEGDVGQSETAGANRSPWLDPIQKRVSQAHGWAPGFLVGQPWCGTWGYDVLSRAGVPHGDNPFHPSCETMWQRATANGRLSTVPTVGGAILWRGTHTGIVVAVDAAAGIVHTIEGNSGDAVSRRVRALSGTHRFVSVAGVVQGPVERTVTEFWLEDLKAQYQVLGPWRVQAWRDRAYRDMKPARKRVASRVTTGDGLFAIRVGDTRHIGPWATDASRRKAQAIWEKRLGRRLRAYNKTRRVSASPLAAGPVDALGKTT